MSFFHEIYVLAVAVLGFANTIFTTSNCRTLSRQVGSAWNPMFKINFHEWKNGLSKQGGASRGFFQTGFLCIFLCTFQSTWLHSASLNRAALSHIFESDYLNFTVQKNDPNLKVMTYTMGIPNDHLF